MAKSNDQINDLNSLQDNVLILRRIVPPILEEKWISDYVQNISKAHEQIMSTSHLSDNDKEVLRNAYKKNSEIKMETKIESKLNHDLDKRIAFIEEKLSGLKKNMGMLERLKIDFEDKKV